MLETDCDSVMLNFCKESQERTYSFKSSRKNIKHGPLDEYFQLIN